jgi:hypothetical protein
LITFSTAAPIDQDLPCGKSQNSFSVNFTYGPELASQINGKLLILLALPRGLEPLFSPWEGEEAG